ncbi:MAG: hypothetical protein LBQ03_02600 [Puniceicoccales bacterium]|jgi:hypothetical protein|nr:hypothetical protein [Puniceicoccales bacterium]
MELYRSLKEKRSGSITLVVLIITAFCTLILELFLESVLDNAKYRQQMLCPADLKAEAYSALDLALSFLEEYKKNQSVEKIGDNSIVRKGDNKLIFDEDILGKIPDNTLISNYIAKKIALKLSTAALPSGFPKVEGIPGTNQLKHGDFTVQYEFEDLSAKVPLCETFDDATKPSSASNGLVITVLDNLTQMNATSKTNIKNFIITQKNIATKWSTIEHVAKSNVANNNIDIEPLKKLFTIEPYIINAITKGKNFKINLLTTPKKILDAISAKNGNLSISTSRKARDYARLIGPRGALEPYCCTEVQFFALKVRVSTGTGNSYAIRCVCDAMSNKTRNQRLPFNIIKIEEF